VIVAEVIATDHSELDARAQKLAESAPPVPPARPVAPVQTGPLLPSQPASAPAKKP
jgi:hypothetical protein